MNSGASKIGASALNFEPKTALCLSKFTQTWREKPAKPLRLGVLFQQTAQTWRENQARQDLNGAPWAQPVSRQKKTPHIRDVRGVAI